MQVNRLGRAGPKVYSNVYESACKYNCSFLRAKHRLHPNDLYARQQSKHDASLARGILAGFQVVKWVWAASLISYCKWI